jgi:RecJ-like exonuclease
MIQTLKRLDKRFSVKILKRLEDDEISTFPKDKIILFLDLASGSLKKISENNFESVFIIDHHEIAEKIPDSINIINPQLNEKEELSSSSLVYLFCKEICDNVKDLAKLAILGMIGDSIEKNIDKLNHVIIQDGEVKKKRGLLIYPSTRPLNRVLEYCSDPYIPGITGDTLGVIELLREIGINSQNGKYKSLIELNDEEMSRLVTAIILKNPKVKNRELIGDIFLIKFFNKLEDARELSAVINACSRLGEPETAIQFCMEFPKAKKRAELMHTKYKQQIVQGLNQRRKSEKIEGNGFYNNQCKRFNKRHNIGTIASIVQFHAFEEGNNNYYNAYYDDKESSRGSWKKWKEQRGVLASVMKK